MKFPDIIPQKYKKLVGIGLLALSQLPQVLFYFGQPGLAMLVQQALELGGITGGPGIVQGLLAASGGAALLNAEPPKKK